VAGLRALGLAGGNVTVPHKERVIAHLDEVDEEARFIGAVNTFVGREGRLVGYNTDGRGFMRSLEEAGVAASGAHVAIVGTGGAARAIGYYLAREAARLDLFDIDRARAEALARDLGTVGRDVRLAPDTACVAEATIVVNATPLGLRPTDPLPFDPARLRADATVIDLIYRETPLLRAARERGLRTLDGLGMLLWQGVLAFRLWTGVLPPVDLMRERLRSAIG
jgi:shikimate dehydrogenase